MNEKNIVDIYDNNIAKDSNGKIYTWNYNWNNETLDLLCLNDMGGDVLKDVIIEEVYYSGNVLKDNKGKIYIFNNETSEWICINDIEGNILNGKNIADVVFYEQDISQYIKYVANDINGNVYEINYKYDNGELEVVCINDIENSELKGKKIRKIVMLDASVCYITEDNECYIYSWELGIPV